MSPAPPPLSHRRSRLVRTAACAAATAALMGGCGGRGDRVPALNRLPLVPGLHVVARQRVCDRGRNAYCALELVLAGHGYSSSHKLQRAERILLGKRGWKKVNAPVGLEVADDSPVDRLRVTYAAANMELEAVDLGWVKRSRPITLALSREIFAHQPAMAVLLQLGTT